MKLLLLVINRLSCFLLAWLIIVEIVYYTDVTSFLVAHKIFTHAFLTLVGIFIISDGIKELHYNQDTKKDLR